MPRKSRIDAPGALHHIISRGIERGKIFQDITDRNNFLERFGGIIQETGCTLNCKTKGHPLIWVRD